MLAQLPELRVAARTSSFSFKGKDAAIGEIASALGVAHVLEGSVQKAGDRVRVTAQLIRAEDGFHVWSQNYTRPLEDIFAIQDEIAQDVANALDTSLLGGQAKVYLKAVEQQAIFSYSSLELAESLFKQALAADPDFIDAKVGLVRNYVLMQDTGLMTREAARDAAHPLLQQITAAQPENREAYAFGLVMQTWEPGFILDREHREQVFGNLRNLLPLMPTETYFRIVVANFLANFHEQYDEALQVVEAGLMVDPLAPTLHSLKGRVYMAMEDFDQAGPAFLRALELDPENPNYYARMSNHAAAQDDLPGKLNWMRKAAEVDPQDHELSFHLAEDMYDLKLPEEGDRWASRVYALAPNSAIARKLQMIAALARDDRDETLRLCKAIIEDRIDDRRGAFGDSVFTYGSLMMMENRSREAYDYLVSQDPSISDFSVLAEGPQAGSMQWVANMVKIGFAPRAEVLAEWESSMAAMEEAALPWAENEYNRFWDAYVRGDLDQAARILIEEIWSKPLATYIARSSDLGNAPLRELLSRPDVMAAKAERDEKFLLARAEVQEMLLSPEWNE
jgi:tetratricopeptide (TPR) repeat protein